MKATLTINIPDKLAQTKEQRDRLARHFRKWSRGCSDLLEPLLEDDSSISVTNHQLDAPWPEDRRVLGPISE